MNDPTTTRVIVNADDFGLTPGVNRGIVSGFRDGILTSTTMMVNMKFCDEAIGLAKQNPGLGVGVHLTLLWGRPLSDAADVPSLVDGEGFFPRSLTTLALRYGTGRLDLGQVATEFRAQVRKFRAGGLEPTHLDTHKHVHSLPGVLDALIEVASEFGIRRVRFPAEAALPAAPGTRAGGLKRRLIRAFCAHSRPKLEAAGIRTPDRFVGIGVQDCLNSEVFRRILCSLDAGTTEIMCHPGYIDEHLREYSRVPPHRDRELESLKDPELRRLVEEKDIRLMHYGEL